jgi:hypothetical protein
LTLPLHDLLGPGLPLGGRTPTGLIGDLAPGALLFVDRPGAPGLLTTPAGLERRLNPKDGERPLRGRLHRGPRGEGLPVDLVGALQATAEVLRARGGAAWLPQRLTHLAAWLGGDLARRRGAEAVAAAERALLGLDDAHPHGLLRAWDGRAFVDATRAQLHQRPGLLLIPGLQPDLAAAFGPLLDRWSARPEGLVLGLQAPVLSVAAAQRAARLRAQLGDETHAAAVLHHGRVIAASTGGLVAQAALRRLPAPPSQTAGRLLYAQAPLRGSPLFSGDAHEGLTAWLAQLGGAAGSAVQALVSLGLLMGGDPSAILGAAPGSPSLVLARMVGALLVQVLQILDDPSVLPGIADLRPPEPTAAPLRRPAGHRAFAVGFGGGVLQPIADSLGGAAFGGDHDGLFPLASMELEASGLQRLPAAAVGHPGALGHGPLLDQLIKALEAPLPGYPSLCAHTLRWLGPQLRPDLLKAREVADALGFPSATPLDEAPHPLFRAPDPGPPAAPRSYAEAHRLCHELRRPLPMDLAWCGIAGARTPLLVVPADPDGRLEGLQGLCGVDVKEEHRAALRAGQIAALAPGEPHHPIWDQGCRVVLVPVEHDRALLVDEWRALVERAIGRLMDDGEAPEGPTGPTAADWPIAVFLPDPRPTASTAQLTVALIEAAIGARAARLQTAPGDAAGEPALPERSRARRALRPLRIAISWEEDHEACADAVARFAQLTRLADPPRLDLAALLPSRLRAGDGYGKRRPARLLAAVRPWTLQVRVGAGHQWAFSLHGPEGVFTAAHEVPPAVVSATAAAARAGDVEVLAALRPVPPALRAHLRAASHLELLLDPEAEDLPWEALQVDGAPLCLRGLLVRRSAAPAAPRPRSEPRALVLADLGGDLPAARDEAAEVRNQLNGALRGGAEQLVGPQASPEALRARLLTERLRAWHLASHGSAGALLLSMNPPLALQASDLLGARHTPEIAVLNCCSMEVGSAEGLRLPRALRERGSAAVVSTGWEVPDAPARAFATRLWRELLRGLPLAEAAHRARLAARALDPSPACWTAWQIWGDPDWRFTAADVGEPRHDPDLAALPTEEQRIDALYTLQGELRTRPRSGAEERIKELQALVMPLGAPPASSKSAPRRGLPQVCEELDHILQGELRTERLGALLAEAKKMLSELDAPSSPKHPYHNRLQLVREELGLSPPPKAKQPPQPSEQHPVDLDSWANWAGLLNEEERRVALKVLSRPMAGRIEAIVRAALAAAPPAAPPGEGAG